MAEIFKFFNSAPGDERWHYASDFAEYFGDVLSSGLIHKNNVPGLQVTVVPNSLKTKVDIGQGLIKGYSYQNTTPIELNHDITEIGLNRIDRIVLRLDLYNANRYIKVFVKKGTEAVNPVAPALQRDQYIYELSLAQVRVNSNSTVINPTSLVDERMKEDLCGIVHSLISVPTSVFQQQWDYWFNVQSGVYTAELLAWIAEQKVLFNNWKAQEQSDFTTWRNQQTDDFNQWRTQEQVLFDTWFADLQELLDENIALNLLAKVTNLEQELSATNQRVTEHLDHYEEFKNSKGQPNGLATLDDKGNIPKSQLKNVENLDILYGKASIKTDFSNKDFYYKTQKAIDTEFFDYTVAELFTQYASDANSYVGINNSQIMSSSFGGYSVIYNVNPIDLSHYNEIKFMYKKPSKEATGVSYIGLQKNIDTTYTIFDISVQVDITDEFTELILDVSQLEGEYYIKLVSQTTQNPSPAVFNRMYINSIKLIGRLTLDIKDNKLSLLDGSLSGTMYLNFKARSGFLGWHSLMAVINKSVGTNVFFDMLDLEGNTILQNIQNGDIFDDIYNTEISIAINLTRESADLSSPTVEWFDITFKGLDESDTIIYDLILDSSKSVIVFSELEEYTEIEIEYIPISTATSNITLTFNDVKTSSYNYTGTNNASVVGSTSAIANIPITAGLGRHTIIKVDNTTAKKSGNVEISSYLKTGTLGMFKTNGHFTLEQLINSIQLTAAFPVGSRFIVRGKKEWRN